MKEKEKMKLLSRAIGIAERVSDQLDRAYIAHCDATGIDPNRKQLTKDYRKIK